MAIGSGIGAQLGLVSEVTFNTPVAVSRFLEFNSENLQYHKKVAIGSGLRAGGKVPRVARRVITTSDVTGDFLLDLPTRSLGLLLSLATGSAPSAVVVSAAAVYSYTFTLADLLGKSATIQVGVPQYGGTVVAKTISGAKVKGFELSVANGGIAVGKFEIDGAAMSTAIALATASYANFATTNIFHFAQGALTVDATPVANVKDFSITVDNAIKPDRFNLGNAGVKAEQVIQGFRKIHGKMVAEFTDSVLMNKFLNDTSAAIVLTFTGALIGATAFKETLTITIPAAKFDADTPNVAGPGVVDLSMAFEGYDDGTNEPLTIFYQTADAAL